LVNEKKIGTALVATPSVEESVLALESLSVMPQTNSAANGPTKKFIRQFFAEPIGSGRIADGSWTEPVPIGFYFAVCGITSGFIRL
jgi:hypothetical protein